MKLFGFRKQKNKDEKPVFDFDNMQIESHAVPLPQMIHNLIVLDESGSMSSIYSSALSGVNETLQTIRIAQREQGLQTHLVTLVAFDTNHYNEIYCQVPALQTIDITKNQYRPYGGTPLYDTIGRAINELRPSVGKNDIVLVTIITDGYENASREYSGKAIKALIEQMKTENWVFTYIGANQDVEAVAESMSIDNRMSFESTATGASEMFEKERKMRRKFFDKVGNGCPMSTLSKDYFDD